MSKITRKTQKIFGSTATTNQIAQFGSLAASAPAFSTDPATIQSLSQYLSGWFAAVIGGASPAIEDLNAVHYLFAYQLAYSFQAGVPEWDSGTTYYIGSMVTDGLGSMYTSLTNASLNQALSVSSQWLRVTGAPGSGGVVSYPSNIQLDGSYNGKIILMDASVASVINMPVVAKNFTFTVKDSTGLFGTVTSAPVCVPAGEKIEGYTSSYAMATNWGSWTFVCDGTNWFVT